MRPSKELCTLSKKPSRKPIFKELLSSRLPNKKSITISQIIPNKKKSTRRCIFLIKKNEIPGY